MVLIFLKRMTVVGGYYIKLRLQTVAILVKNFFVARHNRFAKLLPAIPRATGVAMLRRMKEEEAAERSLLRRMERKVSEMRNSRRTSAGSSAVMYEYMRYLLAHGSAVSRPH